MRRYSHFTYVTGRGKVQIEPLAWWSWSTGAEFAFTRWSADSNTATIAKISTGVSCAARSADSRTASPMSNSPRRQGCPYRAFTRSGTGGGEG
jgi:hypothetical protein